MTKACVRPRSNSNARPRPPVKLLPRLNDQVTYWVLRAYTRVLITIGAVSELTARRKRGQPR